VIVSLIGFMLAFQHHRRHLILR